MMAILKPINLVKKMDKKFFLFCYLMIGFVVMLLVTNIVTIKYCALGPFTLTAGAFTYPFTFLFLDLITEIFGKYYAKIVVWIGLGANIFLLGIIIFIIHLPIHAQSPISQIAFEQFFSFMPNLVISSIVAYIIAQLLDIYLFCTIKKYTGKKYLWFRNNISTFLSQVVDTLLFGFLAWIFFPSIGLGGFPIAHNMWWNITLNELSCKVIFTVFSTPLLYLGVFLINRITKNDYERCI